MCVVALAWNAHPHWRVVMAGNRDEFHARPAAPMARWDGTDGIIAGRDLVGGGTWAGVSEAGRLAVIVNVRGNPPDPAKLSRGGLVTAALSGDALGDLGGYNAFAMLSIDGVAARLATNMPLAPVTVLRPGLYGLSNGSTDEVWPRKQRVVSALGEWLARTEDPAALLAVLADESDCGADHAPVFIRDTIYGTRASTVIGIDVHGQGIAMERRFGSGGSPLGETAIPFRWPRHA